MSHHHWNMTAIPMTAAQFAPNLPLRHLSIVALGALLLFAALMPWATLGPFSAAGTDGDGVITLIPGLAAAVLVGVRLRRADLG